jgi:hypothetical protein
MTTSKASERLRKEIMDALRHHRPDSFYSPEKIFKLGIMADRILALIETLRVKRAKKAEANLALAKIKGKSTS